MSFNYLQSYVKMPVSAWCYIPTPTSLPQEQAAKTSMVSEVRIQLCGQYLHMTDHAPHEAGKALHLMDRKEMAYTYQTPFHRPFSVQCLIST